jgi:hypothetical protein
MECGRLNGAVEEYGLLKEFEDNCYISKKIAHFMDLKHGSCICWIKWSIWVILF